MRVVATGWLIAASLLSWAAAAEPALRVEAEFRHYPQLPEPREGGSLALGLASTWQDDSGDWQAVGELFGRWDGNDAARTHADIREAYLQWLGEGREASIGLRQQVWGVVESRHLVDILNQTDFVEDLESEHKLGQPLLQLALESEDRGRLDAFLLPYFRERTFPGPRGQPRVPIPIDESLTRYESPRGRRHLDTALRYQHRWGGLDWGLSWFSGTAREPTLPICLRQGSGFEGTEEGPRCDLVGLDQQGTALTPLLQQLGLAPSDEQARAEVIRNLLVIPVYPQLEQLSLDALWALDRWALKLEALQRRREGERSTAWVAGVEYFIGNALGSGWNLGLVGERLRDDRDDLLSTRFDDEWFAGLRVGFNDRRSSSLLLGLLADARGRDRVLQLEAQTRPAPGFRLSMTLRSFDRVPGDELTGFLRNEDGLQLRLERFF